MKNKKINYNDRPIGDDKMMNEIDKIGGRF